MPVQKKQLNSHRIDFYIIQRTSIHRKFFIFQPSPKHSGEAGCILSTYLCINPCEPRKKPLLLSIESWLVDRDPYIGLLKPPYNWVVIHPLYNLNNQGPFFHCSCNFFEKMAPDSTFSMAQANIPGWNSTFRAPPEWLHVITTPEDWRFEPEHDGLVQMIFRTSRGVFSSSILIFRGVMPKKASIQFLFLPRQLITGVIPLIIATWETQVLEISVMDKCGAWKCDIKLETR